MTKRMSALLSLLCVAVMTFAQIHEPIKCETSWKMGRFGYRNSIKRVRRQITDREVGVPGAGFFFGRTVQPAGSLVP